MSVRYITVPEPVVARNPMTKKPVSVTDNYGAVLRDDDPWTLYRFLATFVLTDSKRFGNNLEALRTVLKLYDRFEAAQPGDVVEVEEAAWKKMSDVVEERGDQPYPPAIAHQLIPLMDAVVCAPKEDPRRPKKAVAEA